MSAPAAQRRRILVVGSINADVFIDIDRLPLPGETMSTNKAESGHVLPGGKGANQAVAVAKALKQSSGGSDGFESFWVGRYGNDAHASMLRDVLRRNGVRDDLSGVADVPSGQAFILLQRGGENSIILVAGANHSWPDKLEPELIDAIKTAAVVMLQREIPERINILVAQTARAAGVPVFLDMGGEATPLSAELLSELTYLTANETELARVAGLPTDTDEQVLAAARQVQSRRPGLNVFLTLGSRGSMLVLPDEKAEVLREPALPVKAVVDTTGAGDCCRGAFTVALMEGAAAPGGSLEASYAPAMKFAAAAAALCIQKQGAMPSMPLRAEIEQLLHHPKQ